MTPTQVRTMVRDALEDFFGGKNVAELVAMAVKDNIPTIPPSNAAEVAKLAEGIKAIGKKIIGEDFMEVPKQTEDGGENEYTIPPADGPVVLDNPNVGIGIDGEAQAAQPPEVPPAIDLPEPAEEIAPVEQPKEESAFKKMEDIMDEPATQEPEKAVAETGSTGETLIIDSPETKFGSPDPDKKIEIAEDAELKKMAEEDGLVKPEVDAAEGTEPKEAVEPEPEIRQLPNGSQEEVPPQGKPDYSDPQLIKPEAEKDNTNVEG